MIGDATRLLSAVRRPANLRKAFRYALRDRLTDHYYDPFELERVGIDEQVIIAEVAEEFKPPISFTPRTAYAYYLPKNNLCMRRMVYIPFKDLVARYAFVIVLSDLLDRELSRQCFANRRARGEFAHFQLLENFADVSWPRFCKWQKNCASSGEFSLLLRTDISAFYDSVCHEYLIDVLESQLAIEAGSDLMRLFRKLLRIPVVSYSHLTGQPGRRHVMRQGLAIGNATEGVLANLYLKTIVDDAMGQIDDVSFGRYNDDMRIFAREANSAERARVVLQQQLLASGLNLNVSKTEIAKGSLEIEKLRARAYEASDYTAEEDELAAITGLTVADNPFDECNRQFEPGQVLKKEKDAKDFCHFLGRVLTPEERRPVHVEMLRTVLTRWHGSSRYACWRLVETLAQERYPATTRGQACKALVACLADRNVSDYAKYRLLHHLSKGRQRSQGSKTYRVIDSVGCHVKNQIKRMLPRFLSAAAFPLNIISLYAMKALGASHAEMETAVQRYSPKPVGIPIRNALILAQKSNSSVHKFALAHTAEDEEARY